MHTLTISGKIRRGAMDENNPKMLISSLSEIEKPLNKYNGNNLNSYLINMIFREVVKHQFTFSIR